MLCNSTDICQQRIPELYEDQLVSAQKAEASTPALPGEGGRIHSIFTWFFRSGREETHRRRADPLPSPYGASSSRTLNHLTVMVPILRKRKPGLSEAKPPYWVPGRERAPGRASASASGKPRAASLGTLGRCRGRLPMDQDEWRVNDGEESGRVPSPTPAATPSSLFVVPFSFQELRI